MSCGARGGPTFMSPPGRVPFACDVTGVRADAGAIAALAGLQLAARRIGCELRLRNASSELTELVAFAGLADVLRVEPRREAEEREERLRVEEEGELPDPVA
jgi:hypothetical protein